MVPVIEKVTANLPSLNFLVYADSGAGKTVFAGSAERVLFIAPEDAGLLSAAMMGSKADKIKVKSWDEFVEAYEYCYDNQFDLQEKYDWIVIDSATEMQGMCLRDIVAKERATRISKDQDPDQPQLQDYGKLYILMEKMVLAFNDLEINCLYTALTRSAEDPDANEFLLPMLGSNKPTDYRIAMKIAAHMTSYGHFKVEVVSKPKDPSKPDGETKKVKQRVIYWEDNGIYRGKDRTTRLGAKMVLPPKMALQFVTDVARGKLNRDGTVVAQKPPAKKAPVKKVAASGSGKSTPPVPNPEPNQTEPENEAQLAIGNAEQRESKRKYDPAQDPSDMNGASNEVELESVEA